jgi:hypothetical protein
MFPVPQCRTCSAEFPATTAGRGRPSLYCSDECRRRADVDRKRGKRSTIDARIQSILQRLDEIERQIRLLEIPENSAE